MKVFHTISETRDFLKAKRREGLSIGFVPTMGALHEGHVSLIYRARRENDIVLCSIFVNPTQFGNPEDLKIYPRSLETDATLLEKADCDVIFAPSSEEMYVSLPELKLDFGNLEHVMEGRFRPGHFNGVGTVVSKLFHIVNPHRAYFGLKDLQQVAVLNRLVKDLSFDLELIPCPIVREKDGLAMSSRNTRLSPKARGLASQINKSLQVAKKALEEGLTAEASKEKVAEHFKSFPEFELEYLEISDFENLEPLSAKNSSGKTAICIASYLDNVRLIDNIVF
ncbi:MAG: pantoate--beta-alanine ligase [Arcticibacterium sp.]|jgi:pantoate--beta-alanine ligase